MKRKTAVVLSFVFLVTCAVPAAARAQQANDAAHQKAMAMSKAVIEAVYAMPEYTVFSDVNLDVLSTGEVMITGDAATKELKSNICPVVQKVSGVTECVNNLLQLTVSAQDREVRGRVYESIYTTYLPDYSPYPQGERPVGGNLFRGPHPIRIIVDSGKVMLYGYVYSAEDKGSATHAAEVAPGVTKVENYLQVVQKPSSSR